MSPDSYDASGLSRTTDLWRGIFSPDMVTRVMAKVLRALIFPLMCNTQLRAHLLKQGTTTKTVGSQKNVPETHQFGLLFHFCSQLCPAQTVVN